MARNNRQSLTRFFRFLPRFLEEFMWTQVLRRRVEKGGKRLVPEQAFLEKLDFVYSTLLQSHEPEAIGDYFEFGVFTGTSLGCAYQAIKKHGLSRSSLYGFDSFDGLPPEADQDDGGVWHSGQFKTTLAFTRHYLNKVGVDWDRTHLIKGFFSDSLTPELKQRFGMQKASVIMVDCDMYLSTKEALEFCEPLIADDCMIIFDDWFTHGLANKNLGEKKAFEEFLSQHPQFEAEEHPGYNDNSIIFRVRRITD